MIARMSKPHHFQTITILFITLCPILIHLLNYLELVTVPMRVSGGVLSPLALSLYGGSILLAGIVCFSHLKRLPQGEEPFIVTLFPILLALIFAYAMFMTKWLQDAQFAPYHSLDSEIVIFISYLCTFIFVALCLFAGERKTLFVIQCLHLGIYLAMYGLPHWRLFPDCLECIVGPRLHVLIGTNAMYLVGLALCSAKPPIGYRLPTKLIAAWCGALLLMYLWYLLPQNGEHIAVETILPLESWSTLHVGTMALNQLLLLMVIVLALSKMGMFLSEYGLHTDDAVMQ